MTAAEVMAELERLGTAQTKKTYLRHGAREPLFGVKVGDLKVIQKKVKVNHPLARELYATGNSDAMYLAGLIADPRQMTKTELRTWLKAASWGWLGEYTVPWVAAESPHAVELAREWMAGKAAGVRAAGWNTYASHLGVTPDDELDIGEVRDLLARVERDMPTAPDRVKYCMNGFVIAVGCFVLELTAAARETAKRVGKVTVDMGDTDCKVPDALGMIAAVEARGTLGRKRKSARC